MDAATIALLNRILARETRSLLQYMSDAWPWTDAEHSDLPERLQRIVNEEREAHGRLTKWLLRHKISLASSNFPKDFSNLHFIAMDHLLPQLIDSQRHLVKQLESDVTAIRDEEACAIVQKTLEEKRRHLAELEQLSAQYAGKVVSTLR
jgi:hypothetical protein